MNGGHVRTMVTALVAISALALPLVTQNAYFIQVASAIGIAVILALGLSLLYGYAGQMSFAQAGLYGVGAYSSVIMTTKLGMDFLVGLAVGVIVPGVLACLIGIPTLKLRGHYLAIATLALQLGIVQFFIQASNITGGTVGVFGIERPTILGISFKSSAAYYELIAVAAIRAWPRCWSVRSFSSSALVSLLFSPAAGSSSRISFGSVAIARASSRSRPSPAVSRWARTSARWVRPTISRAA